MAKNDGRNVSGATAVSKVHEFATLLVWYTFIGPLSQYCNVYFTSEATSHGHNAAILSPGISDRLHTWSIVKMILSRMTTTPTGHDSARVWCGFPKAVSITHSQVGPIQPLGEISLNGLAVRRGVLFLRKGVLGWHNGVRVTHVRAFALRT